MINFFLGLGVGIFLCVLEIAWLDDYEKPVKPLRYKEKK